VQKKPKILFVDDSSEICFFMRNLLAEHNFEILTANDGISALKLLPLLADHQCILMTDYEMPKMNGKELLMRLQETPHPFACYFLLSGLDQFDELIVSLLEEKLDRPIFFYQKPYLIQEIVNKLKTVT